MTDLTGYDEHRSTSGSPLRFAAANKDGMYAVLNHISDGVVIFGLDGVTYANAALAELLGYPQPYLDDPAFSWSSVIHEDDRERTIAWCASRLTESTATGRITFRIRTQSGHERHMDVTAARLPEATPTVVGIARDFTACNAAESVATNTSRLLEAVAGVGQSLIARQVGEPELLEALEILRGILTVDRVCIQVTRGPDLAEGTELIQRCVGRSAYSPPLPIFERWRQELAASRSVLWDGAVAPEDERIAMMDQGVRSAAAVRLAVGSTIRGILRFDSMDSVRHWTQGGLIALQATGAVFAIALAQREAETLLEDSEARFQRLVDSAPDIIYRMSLPDGAYEYMSPAASEILGYPPDEFYRHPRLIQKIVHPGWRVYFEDQWERLVHGDAPPSYAYAIIHGQTGETRWCDQRNVLVRDGQGKPIAIEGIVTDVTMQKLAECRLRNREATLNSILSTAPIGVGTNSDRTMLIVNDELCRISGYTSEELVGRVTAFLYPTYEEFNRVGQVLVAQLEKGTEGSVVTQWRRKDGTILDVLVSANCLDPADYAAGVTFTVLDIAAFTERTAALDKRTDRVRQEPS